MGEVLVEALVEGLETKEVGGGHGGGGGGTFALSVNGGGGIGLGENGLLMNVKVLGHGFKMEQAAHQFEVRAGEGAVRIVCAD